MENSVKGRLEAYLKFKRISKSEFGRAIGVSAAYVGAIRRSIDPEKLKLILQLYPDLSQEWLLTGNGEMLVSLAFPPGAASSQPSSSSDITIPGSAWAVICQQAASLERKDSQQDALISLLRESFNELKGAAVRSAAISAAADGSAG